MANPRKFSEKIALHTQKQAEETAAFEAILQEVTSATRDPPRYQKQQHIVPTLGTYRAGSLPNVNQISAKQGIDLQATLQQIDDMKQGKTAMVNTRHDRHRQQIGPHRRSFQPDKRIDSSPYGSAYHLSPPPDTSWRSSGLPKMQHYMFSGLSLSRVHSDPSLHMNAMGNASNSYSHPPVTPPSHRRIVEMVGENAGDNLQMNFWDQKKMSPSRPKSCEVPNINIYPSHEHDCNNSPTQLISVTTSNTGSLPDLSVLQFPSPLATPLDQEDPYNTANNVTPVSLSPTSPHHMPLGHQSSQSPNQRRRQASGMSIPSPLVLNQIGGQSSPAGMAAMDPCMQQQYMLCLQKQLEQQDQRLRHWGTHNSLSQPYPTPGSPLYNSSHHRSVSHNHQVSHPSLPNLTHQHISSHVGPITQNTLTHRQSLQNSTFTQSAKQHSNQQQQVNQQQHVSQQQQQQQHVSQQQQQQHVSQQQQQQHVSQQQQHVSHQQQHVSQQQQQHVSQQQQQLVSQQQQLVSQQQHVSQQPQHVSQQPQHVSQQQQHVSQQQQHISQQQQQHVRQQSQQQSPLSPPVPLMHVTTSDDQATQVSMTQYRNSVPDSNCQSPTSPHSASSYSPVQSPGIGPTNQVASPTFTDAYYIQQQQQQTNALQHQFEQFNMSLPQVNSTTLGSSIITSNGLGLVSSDSNSSSINNIAFSQEEEQVLRYSQAALLAMSNSDDLFQPHFLGSIDVMASGQFNSQPTMSSAYSQHLNQQNSLSSPTSSSKIPDIILTGADDMYRLPFDFAKDLGNAITGMTDSFDADFLTNDEAFKAGLDPLDFEEIQMLTDASLVADPAIEDSFKLDRL